MPPEQISVVETCRAGCGGKLELGLSLGEQYVVDFPERPDADLLRAPLDLMRCPQCGLVQLRHTVSQSRLFKKFWYRSGINEQMRAALKDIVLKSVEAVGGAEHVKAVLDIGCNDGTLLAFYGEVGPIVTVGFDPAGELVEAARISGYVDYGYDEFFSEERAKEALKEVGRKGYDIITAIAMFYDVPQPLEFLRQVKSVLAPRGVFVLQLNSLWKMYERCAFDNICHEHLAYYSLRSLLPLLAKAGLFVWKVEENDVNGGSFRLYCRGYDGFYLSPLVHEMLGVEKRECVDQLSRLWEFGREVETISIALSRFLISLPDMGQVVRIYGASTRGTTLVQTLSAPAQKTLRFAVDRDPNKWGRYMVGTWSQIIPEAQGRDDTDYFLVLPYHFLPSILEREREWMKKGGQLIVPLPTPRVIPFYGVERKLL